MPLPPAGSEPEAWLALDLIPGLGSEGARRLLKQFGSPSAILSLSYPALASIVNSNVASAIVAGADPAKLAAALAWLDDANNHLLTLADADYPALLMEIADPPVMLFLKGRRELLGAPGLAVVGSRNATPGGKQTAELFSDTLSDAGLTIVSGMAMGIDAAAHQGGLAGRGSSIAVVGTGLDLVYPARNKGLAHTLAENGLIMSEFSLGTPALANNFPRRNRIISGLSRGVLVVEAALASGSLITARIAAEQGRDVFAIPGSIHSPFAKGCHHLIKQGAKLVDDASDILLELGLAPGVGAGATANAPGMVGDLVLDAMGFDPVSIDALTGRVAMPTEKIVARLTELELDGAIASLPGGKYQRLG